jgi:hypothetical protein
MEMNNESSLTGVHVSNNNTMAFVLLLGTSDNTLQAYTCLICMTSTMPSKHFSYKRMLKTNSTNV